MEPVVGALTELRGSLHDAPRAPGQSRGPGHSPGGDSCAEVGSPTPSPVARLGRSWAAWSGWGVFQDVQLRVRPWARTVGQEKPPRRQRCLCSDGDKHSSARWPGDLAGAVTLGAARVSQGPAVFRGLSKH